MTTAKPKKTRTPRTKKSESEAATPVSLEEQLQQMAKRREPVLAQIAPNGILNIAALADYLLDLQGK